MSNSLENLTQAVNDKIATGSLFFISNDVERALGIEHLLENYRVCFIDNSYYLDYLRKEEIPYFCLEEELNERNSIYRSSRKLFRHNLFQNFLNSYPEPRLVQTFKPSPALDRELAKHNSISINPVAALNRKYENKLSQNRILEALAIPIPKSRITTLENLSYSELVTEFGENFVIQFDRGHTGGSTKFIDSEANFLTLKKQYPQRDLKISSYVNGLPYTVNACVTKEGIYIGGLSYQITGYKELTPEIAGTVGNDFHFRTGITQSVLNSLITSIKKIGKHMLDNGYLGLFGVDLIINNDEIFIIEINARQPASIPFYSKIQLKEAQIPLQLLHLAAFLEVSIDIDPDLYTIQALQALKYSQIFLRAQSDMLIRGSIAMGSYRLQSDNTAIDRKTDIVRDNTIFLDEERDKPLIFQKQLYTITELEESAILLLPQVTGKEISRNSELARMQLNQEAIQHTGKLNPWIIESLKAVYNYLK